MDWLHPAYLWTAAAGPALAAMLFLWAARKRREAMRRFGLRDTVARLAPGISPRRRRWKAAVATCATALLALALAGPRFGTQLRDVKREGVDLVVALDVSASMLAEDVAPNRLDRAKNEIRKLLNDLRGDRVGLVVFAGDAFLQCPLTTDYSAVRLFLDIASPDAIAVPGTDFGAALEMAAQAFDISAASPDDARSRALLFVSDGENHVADIEELTSLARDENIVLFAAGVGETDGSPIPVYRNGRRIGFRENAAGDIVRTRLEEQGLRQLSGGGAYFRIARTSSSLSKITAALERLERNEFAQEEFEEYDEKFQWPLALALLLLLLERSIPDRRTNRSADSPGYA